MTTQPGTIETAEDFYEGTVHGLPADPWELLSEEDKADWEVTFEFWKENNGR